MFIRERSEVDVYLFVADVQVAAYYHSFALFLEVLAVAMEGFLVLLSFVEQPL